MKKIAVISAIFLLITSLIAFFPAPILRASSATESAQTFEESKPYIELATSRNKIPLGGEVTLTLTYGNIGRQTASDISLVLNSPYLDGRAPLTFITASQEPDFKASGYGNIASFNLDEIKPGEEKTITLTARVRESAQINTKLPADATLTAPHRPPQDRIILSNPITLEVVQALGLEEPEDSTDTGVLPAATSSPTPSASPSATAEATPSSKSITDLFKNETLRAVIFLLVSLGIIIFAFIIGRFSKTDSEEEQ